MSLQIEPYIQKGNEGFVHHYIIYECEGNFTDDDLNEGANCYSSANMPYRSCQKADLIAGWAVGGEVSLKNQTKSNTISFQFFKFFNT